MIPGSSNPLMMAAAPAAGGYQIERSLRFNSSDSGFLSRTPAVAGNRQLMTQSLWIKRSRITTGAEQTIFVCFNSGGDYSAINLKTDPTYVDQIQIINVIGGIVAHKITEPRLRDPSAWYHILWSIDEANGTAEDRFKLYINNQRVVNWALNSNSSGGNNWSFNRASVAHQFGSTGNADYCLADIHHIDGQALTPSSFTEVSATTGQLIPIEYTGTFGTNGFHLKFADNSAATAATLGKDYSGNSNNWTPNNLSVTAGAGNDSLVDTPTSISATDTGVGGEIRGNYCTWNPLNLSGVSLSNGNLQALATSTEGQVYGTFKMPYDKIYFELTSITNGPGMVIGVAGNPPVTVGGSGRFRVFDGNTSGNIIGDNWATLSSLGAGWAANDIIGIAYDGPSGSIKFYKNGSLVYTDTTINTTLDWFPWIHLNSSVSAACHLNWGQRAFAYTAPSGFKALCDTNLGAPLVAKPNTLMDVALYSGNNSTQTIPLSFEPDFIWLKCRNSARLHRLVDTVRGLPYQLFSSATDGGNTYDATSYRSSIASVNSSGFVVDNTLSIDQYNTTGETYVAWAWDAGTSTVSNTAGSITSQVRANVSAGFSVATLTTPGSGTFTVGHGLNVAPSLVICKARNAAFSWIVYHRSAGAGNYLVLNSTAASAASATVWQNTNPSSTIVYGDASNWGTADYVMYSFAPVVGYGNGLSYVGNGSADGPFVYLGFRPKLILIKCSSTTGNWVLLDAEREGYNVDNDPLFPNLSDAEGTTDLLDITSNGFKIRSTNADVNASAATYIVYAWASNPFQYSRAR